MLGLVLVVLSGLAHTCFGAGIQHIVGGQDAQKGAYPWQIMLKYEGSFYCGGTILDKRNILTAAHCVDSDPDMYWGTFSIVAGEHDLTFTEGTEQEINATEVVVHADYDDWELFNDIALIHLEEDLDYNDYVKPVPQLSNKQFDRDAKWQTMRDSCFTTGWGVFDEDTREIPDILQELPRTNVVSNMKCNKKLEPWGFSVNRRMICTFDKNKGVCNGDSGGPMGCFDAEGNFTQIGIVSWGPSYYCSNGRQVFTRVSKFIDWIEENKMSSD